MLTAYVVVLDVLRRVVVGVVDVYLGLGSCPVNRVVSPIPYRGPVLDGAVVIGERPCPYPHCLGRRVSGEIGPGRPPHGGFLGKWWKVLFLLLMPA